MANVTGAIVSRISTTLFWGARAHRVLRLAPRQSLGRLQRSLFSFYVGEVFAARARQTAREARAFPRIRVRALDYKRTC